jgi:streptogramin lyase
MKGRVHGSRNSSRRWRRVAAVAVVLGASLALTTGLAGAAPLGQVATFNAGLSGGTVMGSAGPDGNIWLLEGHAVGKITPAGVITEYSAGLDPGNSLFRMGREGHNGKMWFSDRGATRAIGRITTDGVITEFKGRPEPDQQSEQCQDRA